MIRFSLVNGDGDCVGVGNVYGKRSWRRDQPTMSVAMEVRRGWRRMKGGRCMGCVYGCGEKESSER